MSLNTIINRCFTADSESYIVIPSLLKMCDRLGISKKYTDRNNLLGNIYNYAISSPERQELLYAEVDAMLKEGMKHIYIKEISAFTNPVIKASLLNPETALLELDRLFPATSNTYVCTAPQAQSVRLQKYELLLDSTNTHVEKIVFSFVQTFLNKSTGNYVSEYLYPMFITLDLKNNMIEARIKSKTTLYPYEPNLIILEDSSPISCYNILMNCCALLSGKLQFNYYPVLDSATNFKRKIYNILSSLTTTPVAIQDTIDSFSVETHTMTQTIINGLELPPIYEEKIHNDLKVVIEKYLSVSKLPNEEIIDNNEAYPVKVSATDSEFTQYSTVAPKGEPLQNKERFFDTKKALAYDRVCDKMNLYYKKRDMTYINSKDTHFSVPFEIYNGWCIIKLIEYVEEADIQNVLSRIIKN